MPLDELQNYALLLLKFIFIVEKNDNSAPICPFFSIKTQLVCNKNIIFGISMNN
jgi:hypothetical protein